MPRSKLSNWQSQRRLNYIRDHLARQGWINREALSAYFATERSLGSMDISAYQAANGPLRKARAGETMKDGTVAVGYKLGGRLMYVARGDEVDSGARWDLLPQGAVDHADWFARVVAAYVADCGIEGAADYFGCLVRPSGKVAACDERRLVWEVWK